MIIVGLTGSIGMGKSTTAAMFARLKIPVFDADAAVHALQGPGGAALAPIEAAFPGTTTAAGVDRPRLGAAVFGNPAALQRLEAILHPMVAAAQARFLARHRRAAIVVVDIPLLFEKGGSERVDVIVVVSAPPEVQRARVMARPGMTAAKFDAILAQQLPDAEKRARADFIVPTGQGRHTAWRAVRRLVTCLRAGKRR
jgi:dephospho-CoA kinase